MTTPDTAAFDAEAHARGYDELLDRDWAPDQVVDTHTHPFAVLALVLRGRMWLTCAGQTRELGPGERFELGFEVPHAERYGPEGATYRVARRRGP